MIEGVAIQIVSGRHLSPEDLDVINRVRREEFGSESVVKPEPGNEDWTKPYFLARRGPQELLAFGRIHTVPVRFSGQIYEILGTATLAAVVKGHRYGRLVSEAMTDYVRATGKTSIGFNTPALSSFYVKNGREIMEHGVVRFQAPESPKYPDDDVNYVQGADGLIERMLLEENKDQVVHLPRIHW